MAYRHSLNTKYTKSAARRADGGAADGSQVECHWKPPVFHNDPVVTQRPRIPLTPGWCSWRWRPCSRPECRWGRPPLQWTPTGRSTHPAEREGRGRASWGSRENDRFKPDFQTFMRPKGVRRKYRRIIVHFTSPLQYANRATGFLFKRCVQLSNKITSYRAHVILLI